MSKKLKQLGKELQELQAFVEKYPVLVGWQVNRRIKKLEQQMMALEELSPDPFMTETGD